MRLLIGLVLAFSLAACTSPNCESTAQVIELIYSSPLFDVSQKLLTDFQNSGYHCTSITLFDGAGRSIGSRYTCTKC